MCVCVCVPDVFVLVNVNLVKLLRVEFIFQRAHVSNHLQGNKSRQDRQHQTLLFGENQSFRKWLFIMKVDVTCV